jgi:hypothetical protein
MENFFTQKFDGKYESEVSCSEIKYLLQSYNAKA